MSKPLSPELIDFIKNFRREREESVVQIPLYEYVDLPPEKEKHPEDDTEDQTKRGVIHISIDSGEEI